MVNDINSPYLDFEIDEMLFKWYEVEGVRKITELSRQVRTLMNYKTATIRYRFLPYNNAFSLITNLKFSENKRNFETLTLRFIKILKYLKKHKENLEDIRYFNLYRINYPNKIFKSSLKELEIIVEKLFIKIHYFSEKQIHENPKFLKLIVKVAQEVCSILKLFVTQFSEFYKELEINYHNLEKELCDIIPIDKSEKENLNDTQLCEGLIL
ncbi:MAG: hypothetical protein ACXAC5_15450 [Promethearchaeota archaeon]|jgi:hypothetical protein